MKLVAGGIICIAIAVFFLYLYVTALRNDSRKQSWPTAEGAMIESSAERVVIGRESGSDNVRTLRGAWTNKVRYTYEVDGVKYTGDQISNNPMYDPVSDDPGEPSDSILAIKDRFPVDATVDVHYDPDEPDRSFLYFRPTGGKAVQLLIGAGFALIGVLLLVFGIKH